ncbi:MAG: hypothetical protein WD827_07580 [Solirubrobacterales bacterium]
MRRSKNSACCGVVLVALLVLALPAGAAEVTRDSYREAVEPICKANVEANRNILKGVRSKVNQGKVKPAGHQFTRAATALKKALRQIKAQPKPPADESRLAEWQKRISEQESLLRRIGEALIADKKHKAQVLSVKLVSGVNLTNAIVLPFEFKHCHFETSMFT